MAKVIFTAWKSKSQLLEVRSEFYPSSSYEGPDLRSHACAMVEAWKLRGNIPHHVEATALLTDAILHDDPGKNSIFSIRATYSAAFCRFVTGLVDSKIHGQRKTMFQRAVDLGLPASFVELRHEATHREPPSLVVLRKATQRSLEWLWDHYWGELDENAFLTEGNDPASTKVALRDMLRDFLEDSETGSVGPVSKKRKRDQEDSIAARLVEMSGVSAHGIRSLATVLVEERFLDSGRRLGKYLETSFDKWDPMLLKIAESHPPFVMYLSEELIHALFFDPANESPKSANGETLYSWMAHLLTSPIWESYRPYCPRSYILTACGENPNHWAKLLGDSLREERDGSSLLPKTCSASIPPSKKDTPYNGLTATQSSISDKLREHGWAPVERWDGRPLGIASTN